MTLSSQGKICLFSCHMLAPVLQMYDDWRGQGIGLNWSSPYEEVIGWIIEELAYVGRREQLPSDESFAVDFEGEKIGDAVFERFSHQLQSIIGDIEEGHNVSSRELHFALYCLWVTKVIEKFGEIMRSPELGGTSYQSHYQDQEADFDKLKEAISNSLESQKRTIKPVTWEYLVQSAQELAHQWSLQVMSTSGLL